MHNQTTLSAGKITNHDEITVALIEPTDGTPPLVRVHWPLRPTTAATHYPAVAAAIVRIIVESATAIARHKAGGL